MDPLTALGLASNVVQFVSFASELISTSLEIHGSLSGCPDDVSTLDTVYGRLGDLSAGLQSCSESRLSGSMELRRSVLAIRDLSRTCQMDCGKLMKIVEKIKTGAGLKGPKFWQSFRTAVRTALEKDEIGRLEVQLSRTQATLTLHICAIERWASSSAADTLY